MRTQLKPLTGGALTIPDPATDQTYVYRAYCAHDTLLYVGVTNDLTRRMAHHLQKSRHWYRNMARLEWELYRTRREALNVEDRLIRTQYPVHNKSGRVPRPPRGQLDDLELGPTRLWRYDDRALARRSSIAAAL